jgi:hypothetical protein
VKALRIGIRASMSVRGTIQKPEPLAKNRQCVGLLIFAASLSHEQRCRFQGSLLVSIRVRDLKGACFRVCIPLEIGYQRIAAAAWRKSFLFFQTAEFFSSKSAAQDLLSNLFSVLSLSRSAS